MLVLFFMQRKLITEVWKIFFKAFAEDISVDEIGQFMSRYYNFKPIS
jgi:hypothetical protein